MNPFLLINLILFTFSIICYVQIRNFTTLLLFVFSSLPSLVLNYWLVPGGFAWRNHTTNMTSCIRRGPLGLPVLGTLPQMMGSLAHQKLAIMAASLAAKRLMLLSLGSTRVVISSHPETAKEILSGSAFSDRPLKESARLLMFERAVGFAPSGNYWRHLRRLAATHLFSPKKITTLEPIRHRLVDEMVEKIEMCGVVVELRGIIQKGSLGNMLESLFGGCLSEERKEELGLMVSEGYELITKFNLEDYFPMVKFLDIYGVKRKCHGLAIRVQSLVGEILKERRESSNGGGDGDDFLSSLISLPQEDQLADADIISILWEMMFRGTDTVAILVEWIMARLVIHQDVQENLHREIDTCAGGQRHVRDSDVANLRYLQAVVKEVLRLHPPGPLLSWARLAVHDVHVDKFLVPAGTTAMVNMWAIAHDPSVWKDPWAFRPERFLEDDDVMIMGSDLRLAPFGSGRRVCPGKALGLATVHLWVARLLQSFDWLPAEPVDLSENLKMSLEMKKPLNCRVKRRIH